MYEKSKITMYKHTFFFVYFFRRYTENEKINYTIKDIKRQAQVEWKEDSTMVSKYGKVFNFNVLSFELGNSRYIYYEYRKEKTREDVFECLINAFKFIGGVPHKILFDNMATVVDRLASTYRAVVINKKFAQFAKDVGFVVNTCRPYRPQTKGKVECVAKLMDRLKVI